MGTQWMWRWGWLGLGTVLGIAAAQDSAAQAAGEPLGSGAFAALDSARRRADEEWLRTVWSQIDTLVRQEDFRLEQPVVSSGVRGAEGDGGTMEGYYYYRGMRYYVGEELLGKVLDRLSRQRLSRRPGRSDLARLRYLSALCCDVLGRRQEARTYYAQVVDAHPGSPFTRDARRRLAQLEGRW
ncbi:MAG: hypothetical protein AB1505_14185 [Candidatus Latescibacterota bacterium]